MSDDERPERRWTSPIASARSRSAGADRPADRRAPTWSPRSELLTINLGPHHPATHGVLRLLCTARGRGGARHPRRSSATSTPASRRAARTRSTGRPSRSSSGWTTSPTTSTRWPTACPSRRCWRRRCRRAAQWLRVIHMELNRIASHLFWLATGALDIGAITMLWWGAARARPDPRPVRDVVGPAHPHALLPGRRRDRGHPARVGGEGAASFLEGRCPPASTSTRRCWTENEIWLQRTKNTGIVSREKLLELGVTGPLLRAAGEPWDLRKAMPYSRLRELRLQDPGGHGGRQLRPLPRAPGGDARVAEDRGAGARRAARGALHHHQPQGRAAAAPRAGHLDGGADPPLQARDRGLPRAAGRGLLGRSSPRAASWAASWWPTARPSPRACTCAIRRS